MQVELEKLTRREFRQWIQSGGMVAGILPVAATEQHLEHLAMEHDWRSATLIARLAAERLWPSVVVAGGLAVGVSEHHMRHPGSLTLRPGTFLAAVEDLIDSLARAGLRHLLVLNGHGGNVAPLRGVWDQYLRRFQINLHFLSYWEVLTAEDAGALLMSGARFPEDLPGHAQEFETSLALAAFPENVRADALADQADPTPALARGTSGEILLARIVERIATYVEEMITGRRVATVPPFHP